MNMNRRGFLKGLSALAGVSLLGVPELEGAEEPVAVTTTDSWSGWVIINKQHFSPSGAVFGISSKSEGYYRVHLHFFEKDRERLESMFGIYDEVDLRTWTGDYNYDFWGKARVTNIGDGSISYDGYSYETTMIVTFEGIIA